MTRRKKLLGQVAAMGMAALSVGCASDLCRTPARASTTDHTVGGDVTGLNGTVVLQNNGGDDREPGDEAQRSSAIGSASFGTSR